MRQYDIDRKHFKRQHYEIIAKRFRVALEPHFLVNATPANWAPGSSSLAVRTALINLALDMALRFEADNSDFDPLIFLTRCSPNPELYPLAELWADFAAIHGHPGYSIKVDG